MSTRLVRINCNGTIFDDDSGDVFGGPEQEDFSWSRQLVIQDDGFSHEWNESHTVDGEVRLEAKLRLQVDAQQTLSMHGTLELWEGPAWNMGASKAIDNMIVDPEGTATVYEGTLADDEGDWARFKLEVANKSNTVSSQKPLSGPREPRPRPRPIPPIRLGKPGVGDHEL